MQRQSPHLLFLATIIAPRDVSYYSPSTVASRRPAIRPATIATVADQTSNLCLSTPGQRTEQRGRMRMKMYLQKLLAPVHGSSTSSTSSTQAPNKYSKEHSNENSSKDVDGRKELDKRNGEFIGVQRGRSEGQLKLGHSDSGHSEHSMYSGYSGKIGKSGPLFGAQTIRSDQEGARQVHTMEGKDTIFPTTYLDMRTFRQALIEMGLGVGSNSLVLNIHYTL